jgi:LPS-assembly lipoprotein
MKAASRKWLCLLFAACSLALMSCGFHLRGTQAAAWPASIPEVRVVVADSRAAYDPLKLEMQSALRTQARVTVSEGGELPQLVLHGERMDQQVLSVGTTGRVSEYLVRYEVSFRFLGSDGKEIVSDQTVRLLRDYTFDPQNVLAKEREEAELKTAMRRDAVQQILRRLSRSLAGSTAET